LNRLTVSGSIAYTTGIVIMTNAPKSPMQYAALVMNLAIPSITVAFVTTIKIVQTAAIEIRRMNISNFSFETICSSGDSGVFGEDECDEGDNSEVASAESGKLDAFGDFGEDAGEISGEMMALSRRRDIDIGIDIETWLSCL